MVLDRADRGGQHARSDMLAGYRASLGLPPQLPTPLVIREAGHLSTGAVVAIVVPLVSVALFGLLFAWRALHHRRNHRCAHTCLLDWAAACPAMYGLWREARLQGCLPALQVWYVSQHL